MSAIDDVGSAGEGIGSAISDAAASAAKSKQNLRKLKQAFNDLSNVVQNAGSAFLDSKQEFAKYNKVLDSTNQFIGRTARNYKTGKTQSAIILFSGAVTGLVKSFLEYSDNQLAIYDHLAKLGINIQVGADDVQGLLDQTSFWYNRYEGFTKAVDSLGTGLLVLGDSSGAGAQLLAKMLNVEKEEDTYIRMGYTLESLAAAQTGYIKLQETTGIKVTLDANVLRRESLEYATSLKLLSALTGESAEKISQKMAEQALDFKFQFKLGEVDNKTRDALLQTATISSTMFGPEVGASVRDFIANGFASVEKSEGLMVVTQGKIATWVQQLENGKITALEFNRNLANSITSFEKDQRSVLKLSDAYSQKMNISTTAIEGANNLQNVVTEQQLKDMMAAADEKQKQKDSLKNVQNAQIDTEREAGKVTSSVLKAVSGPMSVAFTTMMHLVKETALLSAKLGNYILGDQTEAFENVIKLLGTPNDIKGLTTNIDSSLSTVSNSLREQAVTGRQIKDAKRQFEQATAKETALRNKLLKGEVVPQAEMRVASEDTMAAQATYSGLKEEEKRKYGATSEELEAKKVELEKRKAGIAPAISSRQTEERREIAGTNKERVDKVIKFSGGATGDYAHFAEIDPALAEKVTKLAEKYFQMTGKKLNLTSGYRSAEEQTDMYNAWVAAGGNLTDKRKVHTSKYGNLHMPGKTSRHTARGAVDIDEDQLKQLGDQIINGFGLKKPFPIDDPVHIEGAKNGGIFDGPSSGYPMLFHGKEAVVPLLDNSTMGIDLKNTNTGNSFDDIRSSMAKIQEINKSSTPSTNRQSSKSIANGLVDQIDTLISQVSQSNSIYHDIKLYMST